MPGLTNMRCRNLPLGGGLDVGEHGFIDDDLFPDHICVFLLEPAEGLEDCPEDRCLVDVNVAALLRVSLVEGEIVPGAVEQMDEDASLGGEICSAVQLERCSDSALDRVEQAVVAVCL